VSSIDPEAALVLFSGGQDSTVCLAWALERFARVETLGFDYTQRHRVELEARKRVRERITALDPAWAEKLGEDHLLQLGALAAISDTALTREVAIEVGASGLPTTFVPARNLVFFASPARSDIGAASNISSLACARPISPVIPIVATTPSKACSLPSTSGWTAVS
jgi:7-cyano-7-deazaguanine synthase